MRHRHVKLLCMASVIGLSACSIVRSMSVETMTAREAIGTSLDEETYERIRPLRGG